eukprot:TRINITY_DN15470_c0_g1_i1.p1 TRINITY_DN15470_c0_g1~~TRINITY_DN15470_c0_g1_i1.p1  ORF type:complete len:158 (+),score=2.67 TRINITY_DN15470_c0_g1_i1:85-558(+)
MRKISKKSLKIQSKTPISTTYPTTIKTFPFDFKHTRVNHSFLMPHISISPRYYYASLFPQSNPSKLSKQLFHPIKIQYRRTKACSRFSLRLPKEFETLNISSLAIKKKAGVDKRIGSCKVASGGLKRRIPANKIARSHVHSITNTSAIDKLHCSWLP